MNTHPSGDKGDKMKNIMANGIKFFECKPDDIRGAVDGLVIEIKAIQEEESQLDYWWKETDCFETIEDARKHCEKSDNPFWWCTIRVSVTDLYTFRTGRAYLGCCNYKNGLQFIKDNDYINDMIDDAKTDMA